MTTTEHQAPVVPLPEPVPAANERSPNRKPRTGRAYLAWDVARKKEKWLETYGDTANVDAACKRVDITRQKYKDWRFEDLDFRGKIEILNAVHSDSLKQQVLPLAQESFRFLQLLVDFGIKKLDAGEMPPSGITEAVLKVLKSQDIISDRSVVEHTGKGGGPIKYTNTTEIKPSISIAAIEPPGTIEGVVRVLEPEEEDDGTGEGT